MPVELAEIDIHNRRVQKRSQALSQRHRQTVTVDVEIIQVVLKADERGVNLMRVVDARYDAFPLFLGREPFHQHIDPGGHEQLARLLVAYDGAWLARLLFWPMHEAAVGVAGINRRRCIAFRLAPQKFLGPEIHHAPGRYGQAQLRQRR